jgi:uncharacterized protein YqhQ
MSEKTETLRLGGMALRNGLLIHGPTSWSAAVRDRDGEIRVASDRKPALAPRAARTPGLRGPVRLAEAFAIIPIVRSRLPAARLPFEDWRVVVAAVASVAATGALRRGGRGAPLREGFIAVLGLLPALAALRNRDLAAYHGVEHKAIGAYERGSMDPATAPKEHDRCGSNLILPMVLLSAGGEVLLYRLLENPGPLARAGAGLGGASVAVELFAWSDRNPETTLARALHRPGHEIQRLVATREPTAEQLEVGSAALAEILRAEGAAYTDEPVRNSPRGQGDDHPPAADARASERGNQ